MSTAHSVLRHIAQKCVKVVGDMSSGETGINLCMIAVVNTICNIVPQMFFSQLCDI